MEVCIQIVEANIHGELITVMHKSWREMFVQSSRLDAGGP